jgi:glycosyltransferase involved in cell wall biosynthesis
MDPYNKRVDRIIEAWEQVYRDYPDWSLELVGEGPQLPNLKQYVVRNSIERVNFHGFQKEPPRNYYEDAQVLMLTSDLEGFGLVIIEAMQFGVVPVVYGSYVAVHDIIEDGKDGFITSMPYSQDNTIECIRKLMDDESLRQKMAHAAIEKAKRFSLEKIKKEWYSIM